jgi:hypothetical protein
MITGWLPSSAGVDRDGREGDPIPVRWQAPAQHLILLLDWTGTSAM